MRQLLQNGELVMDSELLHERTFAVGPLEFNNERGIGSVPDAAEIYYKGVIVGMTPRRFLSLTPHLNLSERPKTLPYIAGSREAMGMPFFTVRTSPDTEELRVRGHEGRHRMYWIAQECGPDFEVPVAMFVNELAYRFKARQIEAETVERISRGVYRELSDEFVEGPIFTRAFWSHGTYTTAADMKASRPANCLRAK